ncbi:MAG: hypothetical protein Q4G03_07415 [Planctomycetia bacterium]|nr:hypothetical protein [Planctomycetia bacterium]
MGMRFGEANAIPAPTIRKATANEKEFLKSGNEPGRAVFQTSPGQKRPKRRPITKLSDAQIDAATDRVIMGELISRVADDLNVNRDQLAKKIKTRVGMLYMRLWQQSTAYDCLRAEFILKTALQTFVANNDVKAGRLALDVLDYRARVLSFGAVNPNDEPARVAGMTREEVFKSIIEKL